TLLGLAGLRDPPRRHAREAVETAHAAGVQVIMITGDAPDTAAAIAADVGLETGDVIQGHEIDALDDATLTARLRASAVLSRTTPEHKLRVVELLQRAGEIVAMTGDGVNDAPALKKADIGVAMGVRGTDAAKAAADMVLLDDDFSTIIEAMREGRRQDDNIRKFVRFLVSANCGEALAVAGNIVVGAPLILQPVQILWMNLVTDGAPALALGFERAEPEVMARPPRQPAAPVLSRTMVRDITVYGSALGAIALAFFHLNTAAGVVVAQTFAFSALVVIQQLMILNFRADTAPISKIGWTSNPWLLGAIASSIALQFAAVYLWPLNAALGVAPLPAWSWGAFILIGAAIVAASEAVLVFKAWKGAGARR
ncbi:MAG: HAD-IC family P-type ATPase, partial [Maricaulaceae bacterium]